MILRNPGSPEAIKMGCTCAVIDNNYGHGFSFGDSEPMFWIDGSCKLHGDYTGLYEQDYVE